ncbi:MAG: cytochrome c maturation protein CcmE [Enterobacterales bacterium]|nr:cytochrome c maturation protein CcmE [Enterobacterales bacterium]
MAMKPHRKKRLTAILLSIVGIGTVVGLVLYASDQKMNLFITPSEVNAGHAPKDRIFRIGGLVKEGSVKKSSTTLLTEFIVTDMVADVYITYDKLMPDLFREGQGVVAMGRLNDKGVFVATDVLAKHDEEYRAPEVIDALERAGHPQEAKQQAEQLNSVDNQNESATNGNN